MATILTFPDIHDAPDIIKSPAETKVEAKTAGAFVSKITSAKSKKLSPASHQTNQSAEIIIFPGVRIEHIDEDDNQTKQVTLRSASYTYCGIDLTAI